MKSFDLYAVKYPFFLILSNTSSFNIYHNPPNKIKPKIRLKAKIKKIKTTQNPKIKKYKFNLTLKISIRTLKWLISNLK